MTQFTLKPIPYVVDGDRVLIYRQAHERVDIADPDGQVRSLLTHLAEPGATIEQLARQLRADGHVIADTDIADAIAQLAQLNLVGERQSDNGLTSQDRARHASNLAFYELFSGLDRSAVGMHQRTIDSHVLLLGVGGAGSVVLQTLLGAGVKRVTIVDNDVVETKNLARQFCFGTAAVGQRKVAAAQRWAVQYSAGTDVDIHDERVTSADQIQQLAIGCDLVVAALDTPDDIQLLVDEACAQLQIPYVTGGMSQATIYYWSVHPGVSPCRRCLELHRDDNLRGRDRALGAHRTLPEHVNRANGPVVHLLGGLMGLEALRYLSGCDTPAARATYHWFSLTHDMATAAEPWGYHPDCQHCRPGRDPA